MIRAVAAATYRERFEVFLSNNEILSVPFSEVDGLRDADPLRRLLVEIVAGGRYLEWPLLGRGMLVAVEDLHKVYGKGGAYEESRGV